MDRLQYFALLWASSPNGFTNGIKWEDTMTLHDHSVEGFWASSDQWVLEIYVSFGRLRWVSMIFPLHPSNPSFVGDYLLSLDYLALALCPQTWPNEVPCARRFSQTSKHAVSILSGGYVSNASYHANQDESAKLCRSGVNLPFTLVHEFWERPHMPNVQHRPPLPVCPAQAHVSWPVGNLNDEAVLARQVSVRRHMLSQRYKPP